MKKKLTQRSKNKHCSGYNSNSLSTPTASKYGVKCIGKEHWCDMTSVLLSRAPSACNFCIYSIWMQQISTCNSADNNLNKQELSHYRNADELMGHESYLRRSGLLRELFLALSMAASSLGRSESDVTEWTTLWRASLCCSISSLCLAEFKDFWRICIPSLCPNACQDEAEDTASLALKIATYKHL